MFKIKTTILFVLLLFVLEYVHAQKVSEIDSLKKVLLAAKEQEKPKILNTLSWKFRNSKPEQSTRYGKQSIKLSEKYKQYEQLAKAYGFSGVAYRNLGNYPEAFDKYFKGLTVCKNHKLKEQKGYALINIGNLYIYQESYTEAINYLKQAVLISDEIKNTGMSAYCNLNLGRAFLLNENYEKALHYLEVSLTIRNKQNDKDGEAVCYKYIADVLLGQKKYNEALKSYTKALTILETSSDNSLVSDIYEKTAETLFAEKRVNQATKFAERALKEGLYIQNKRIVRNSYLILSKINFKLGKFKKAAEYSNLAFLYNDSLFTQSLSQKISSIKYSSIQESKQTEIDFLNKENKLKETDLKRQRQFQLILFMLLFIMTGVVIFSLILRKKLKKNNKKLYEKQVENLAQRKELKKLLKEEEKVNILLSNESKEKTNRATLADIVESAIDNKLSLNDFLQKALESILKVPWLTIKTQGAIFLKNKDGNLEMIAKKDIGEHRIKACSLVKAGECICGQALAQKESYVGDFRSKFEKKESTIPYIHMKKPIMLGDEVLGLLNLYLEKDMGIKEQDIAFFDNVCSSLANIIAKKQLQIELEQHQNEQNILNQQLFAQSLEVDQRNIEIERVNEELNIQKNKITKQHKDITDSINYAKTIQQALLTRQDLIERFLPKDYFIFFKPKEAVSGDFYYINKVGDNLIFAAADCTGHGVPGGFLTILGITYLHGIVRRIETDNPATALNLLRERVKEVFSSSEKNNKNGLDIALCAINTKTHILQFAGAYNPLWIIRNNELLEYKATSNPIGFYPKEKEFTNHTVKLQNNDKIYIFSDGYVDQIGGDKRRKFMKRKFRDLIKSMSSLAMKKQKELLKDTLEQWKGNHPQVDDIIVMGLTYSIDE